MPACLVIIQGATMGVEISLLPSFGLWTDSLHGFVLAAGMVLTPLTALELDGLVLPAPGGTYLRGSL